LSDVFCAEDEDEDDDDDDDDEDDDEDDDDDDNERCSRTSSPPLQRALAWAISAAAWFAAMRASSAVSPSEQIRSSPRKSPTLPLPCPPRA